MCSCYWCFERLGCWRMVLLYIHIYIYYLILFCSSLLILWIYSSFPSDLSSVLIPILPLTPLSSIFLLFSLIYKRNPSPSVLLLFLLIYLLFSSSSQSSVLPILQSSHFILYVSMVSYPYLYSWGLSVRVVLVISIRLCFMFLGSELVKGYCVFGNWCFERLTYGVILYIIISIYYILYTYIYVYLLYHYIVVLDSILP